jgi:hypothetical protein
LAAARQQPAKNESEDATVSDQLDTWMSLEDMLAQIERLDPVQQLIAARAGVRRQLPVGRVSLLGKGAFSTAVISSRDLCELAQRQALASELRAKSIAALVRRPQKAAAGRFDGSLAGGFASNDDDWGTPSFVQEVSSLIGADLSKKHRSTLAALLSIDEPDVALAWIERFDPKIDPGAAHALRDCAFSRPLVEAMEARGLAIGEGPAPDLMGLMASAIQGGKASDVKWLLDRGASAREIHGWGDDQTPLHELAAGQSPERAQIARLLAERGADVNACSIDAGAPLHVAMCNGDRILVEALLNLGADPDLQDSLGATPLEVARSADSLLGSGPLSDAPWDQQALALAQERTMGKGQATPRLPSSEDSKALLQELMRLCSAQEAREIAKAVDAGDPPRAPACGSGFSAPEKEFKAPDPRASQSGEAAAGHMVVRRV